MKWSEVTADPRFQGANIKDRLRVKEAWYESKVKTDPRYDSKDDLKIRAGVFGEKEPPKRTVLETAALHTPDEREAVRAQARRAAQWATKELKGMKLPPGVREPSPLVYPIEAYKQTAGRAFGFWHALIAKAADPTSDKNPLEGFIKPEKQPSPIESVIKSNFATNMGIDPTDVTGQTLVNGLAGYALDLAGIHLVFNMIPKAIGGVAKTARNAYSGDQGRSIDAFKSTLNSEFIEAGAS